MKVFSIASAAISLALVTSCGTSGSGTQPVSAATGYSNSSMVGTYSVSLNGYNSEDYADYIGSFTADGSGNISSGTFTQYGTNSNITGTCAVTFTGTYSIQSSAIGSATITAASSGSNGCNTTGTFKFAIQAAQQGESILLSESDSVGLLSGTALKQ